MDKWRRFSWKHIKADWKRYQQARRAARDVKHWAFVNARPVTARRRGWHGR